MSKKSPPTPVQPAFDEKTADFPALLERFNRSTCDTESYMLATYMAQPQFAEKAQALLPGGIGKDLDFNGDSRTSSHEWASALVAAKKLKLDAGLELPVEQMDQLIDKAKNIYKETHPEVKGNAATTNSCRTL